jgi:hypothetical protein
MVVVVFVVVVVVFEVVVAVEVTFATAAAAPGVTFLVTESETKILSLCATQLRI